LPLSIDAIAHERRSRAEIKTKTYLRAQAELCLEMARQVSDRATVDKLRAEAARYHAEAEEIESGVKASVTKAAPEQSD
jgi:hypothetical protein